jgi:hypothetical protein
MATGESQLKTFLRRLTDLIGAPRTVRRAITGEIELTRPALDAFVDLIRKHHRQVGAECQDTARALALQAADSHRLQDIGYEFLCSNDAEEPGEYQRLLERIQPLGITVSVIGLGTEADVDADFLKDVAQRGGGRALFTTQAEELPRLFAQEAITVSRSSFVDQVTDVRTVADMVPPGAQLTYSQSSGQLDIYSLTPTIRFERYEVLPWRLGAFAEAGVGAAHVKTFAVSEVNYTGGGSGTDRFEIDESSTQSQAVVTAGVTYPASESSWFEVLGSYTSILADESVDYFGIGVGFRVWL